MSIIAILLLSCNEKADTTQKIEAKTRIATTPLEKSVDRGREIYKELCITCHMGNGKGVPGSFPPLNPSDWLTQRRSESIHAVKNGLRGEIQVNGATYNNIMLPLGLDNEEVADVMNYTIQTWNKGEMVTVEEVAAATVIQ